MLGALTLQGIAASAARDYSPFGQAGARPTFDYVKAGDVIRIRLMLDTAFAGLRLDEFRNAIGSNANVRLVSIDASQLGMLISGYSGPLVVTVQALSDFSRLDDVTRLVAGIAQASGLNVLINTTRGEFISKVEQTGGEVQPSIEENKPGASDTVSRFVDNLTASPISLAVIIGGVVLLAFMAKGR